MGLQRVWYDRVTKHTQGGKELIHFKGLKEKPERNEQRGVIAR